jgi:hypothetical protein
VKKRRTSEEAAAIKRAVFDLLRKGWGNIDTAEAVGCGVTAADVATWKFDARKKGILPAHISPRVQVALPVHELWNQCGGPTGYSLCDDAKPAIREAA